MTEAMPYPGADRMRWATPHRFEPEDPDDPYCGCGSPAHHPRHNVAEPVLPVTPYAGESGWAGSETSHERARDEDADGTTSERQAKVLALLTSAVNGYTWRELAEVTGWHHGQASGALSMLHKEGRVARLTARRDRCQVYVLPEHVNGRETAAHGRTSAREVCVVELQAAADALPDGHGDKRGLLRAVEILKVGL